MPIRTQVERLARIETILERMEPKLDAIEGKLDADVADLAGLKSKGTGILIGTAIAASALGATAGSFWKWLVGLFA